jgi:hypothetical protein
MVVMATMCATFMPVPRQVVRWTDPGAGASFPCIMADLTTYTVAVSAVISAPPRACYDTIADYRVGHPKIVPPRWFGPIVVDDGGVGAGTRIHFTMTVLGQTRELHGEITEPVPGRVLVESYPETGMVTTFTVVEAHGGAARVTIETRIPRGRGLRAAAERAVTRRVLPGVFVAELGRLAEHVGGDIVAMPEIVRAG